ncbi:hypothetical protein SNOG_05184 [Parastagonospora nodorum SN15]|uniref:Uncharacterized protein n=1 Tax=Phaeosphaeria nodorum (strain SN15 / ATCC MYA-4574 / FGSC 10173) TaxID=321614 RepID=Q0UST0_PHANO|nr:hypothetical protein SNOG_05184 [Parastagonospora nodorum SN15]EAT87575.1 hypothetical protein SNOG_05184 [Parastagonospora nodorum SN15]
MTLSTRHYWRQERDVASTYTNIRGGVRPRRARFSGIDSELESSRRLFVALNLVENVIESHKSPPPCILATLHVGLPDLKPDAFENTEPSLAAVVPR